MGHFFCPMCCRISYYNSAWSQQFQYKSFVPTLVNTEWSWGDARINALLEDATRALGELNAYTRIVPDIAGRQKESFNRISMRFEYTNERYKGSKAQNWCSAFPGFPHFSPLRFFTLKTFLSELRRVQRNILLLLSALFAPLREIGVIRKWSRPLAHKIFARQLPERLPTIFPRHIHDCSTWHCLPGDTIPENQSRVHP